MINYIVRRLIMALLVLIIISLVIFSIMRILPGDPVLLLVVHTESEQYTQQQITKVRAELGLDKPIIVQYFFWVGDILHGNLGKSIMSQTPVADEILVRLPITLHLGLTAYVLGLILGILCGVICAIRRGKLIDTIVTASANIGITLPVFWLGMLMIYLFGLHLKVLPILGYTSPFDNFVMSVKQMVMPVICLTLAPLASITRQTRSSMLEVIRQDFIRTAWSKGLKERDVIIRHALKNGLIPIITLSGMSMKTIIGGTVLIETVFNISGIGRLAVSSVLNKDYPLIQGVILIIAIGISLVNLLIDLTYGWLDPRIRYS
jgi:peptide/nickel transport system permease protein